MSILTRNYIGVLAQPVRSHLLQAPGAFAQRWMKREKAMRLQTGLAATGRRTLGSVTSCCQQAQAFNGGVVALAGCFNIGRVRHMAEAERRRCAHKLGECRHAHGRCIVAGGSSIAVSIISRRARLHSLLPASGAALALAGI